METMIVKPGVTLEAQGQKAVGPDLPDQKRTMSRKEYVQLAEKELAGEGSPPTGAAKGPQVSSGDSPGTGAAGLLGGGPTDDGAGGAGAAAGDLSPPEPLLAASRPLIKVDQRPARSAARNVWVVLEQACKRRACSPWTPRSSKDSRVLWPRRDEIG